MAREYFRQADQFPTITALITAPDTVAEQTWRCVLPLLGMTFDQRTDQDALISAVIAAAFGGANIPDGVTCRLLADANKADYESGFDARQTPLGSICFELQFDGSFTGMTDVPITFTVAGVATDAPADSAITLPTITPNTTDITLKDFQGGALPGGFYSTVIPELSDGKSAYQVAVDNGFEGDETAWLASLKGDTGDTGPAGTAGADGADGTNGQGVPAGGTAGQVLSKIDGTDYNTEWVDPPEGGGSGSGGGLSAVVDDTSPVLGGELDADSNKIVNLGAPTSNNDAATKKYVDDNAGGGGSVDIRDVWLFA